MRWLSPKVLFDLMRQRFGFLRQRLGFVGALLGRVGGLLDRLRFWRRPKFLVAALGGVLLLGGLGYVILPTPKEAPKVATKVTAVKKEKTAAQKKAEAEKKRAAAEAEKRLRAQLLADTKRILAAEAKKVAAARERQRQAELDRKLKWIAQGNGRFWKVTRLGYESKQRPTEEKEKAPDPKTQEQDLFAPNAFPLGADESDGTYTMGDDPQATTAQAEPEEKKLPGKDWRKHIWKKQEPAKKKAKKQVKREPEIIPASYIYATIDSSDNEVLALPPAVERVFQRSARLVLDSDYSTEAIEAWGKALPVEDFVSLTAIVRGNLFGAVERIGVRYRLSSSRLDRMKPWAVARIFSLEPTEFLRSRARQPILPETLQLRARKRGMADAALESVEQTIRMHSDFTDPEQIQLLAQAVRMNRRVEEYRADLKKAYLAGENVKMRELYSKRLEGFGPVLADKIRPRFVEQRSRRLAESMVAHLNRGRAFIAVPAINLSGTNGILRILKRKGYRVRYVETDPKKPMLVANPEYVNSPFFGDTLDPTPRAKPAPKIARKKDSGHKPAAKATTDARAHPMAKTDPKQAQHDAKPPQKDPKQTQQAQSAPKPAPSEPRPE